MEKTFRFSNSHSDFQARDARSVFGWRYSPRIVLKAGRGTRLVDLDGNEYYDLTSGMMCMVLGHSHPELTEVMREMAGTFVHDPPGIRTRGRSSSPSGSPRSARATSKSSTSP